MNGESSIAVNHPRGEATRRDFLYLATGAVGTVGALASMIPLVAEMAPDAATLAAGGPVDLDLSRIEPGRQVTSLWRGKPVFVVNRTPSLLQTLQDPRLVRLLANPKSEERQQPSYAQNWHRSIKPEYGVFVGICTHLGCVPKFDPLPSGTQPVADWLGGYFCPCHGSKYDLSGRVFRGVPAPYNLPVPPYHFVDDATLRIGENPPGVRFDFSTILTSLRNPRREAERYFALLSAGGAKPDGELLAPFGLDARDPAFRRIGLGMIEGLIAELEAMEGAA